MSVHVTARESRRSSASGDLFLIGWAVAALFTQAYIDLPIAPVRQWISAPTGLSLASVSAAAFLVLLNPKSVWRAGGFLAAQIANICFALPSVPNCWIISLAIDGVLLLSLIGVARESTTGRFDSGKWLSMVAPPVRLIAVIAYLFAATAKLNHDFLNPLTSCAAEGYESSRIYFSFLPSGLGVKRAVILFVLVLEISVPVLLMIRRTRIWGAVAALSLHFMVGVIPTQGGLAHYDFSAIMLPVLLLFCPEEFVSFVKSCFDKSNRAQAALRRWVAIPRGWRTAALLIAFAVFILPPLRDRPDRPDWNAHWIFLIIAGAYVGVTLAFIVTFALKEFDWRASPRAAFSASAWYLFLFPVLCGLNGLCPYLGLKTDTSFAMYSNLRTEDGRTNHLLLPIWLQVGDYQRDVVEVMASSADQLKPGWRGSFFALQQVVDDLSRERGGSRIKLTYRRGGAVFSTERAEVDLEAAAPRPWLLRKVFAFRALPAAGEPNRCTH